MNDTKCKCPLRDGAHEWYCGDVGEYEYVHCEKCDKSVWMCEVSFSMCKECRSKADPFKRIFDTSNIVK